MRFLVDEDLPSSAIGLLQSLGHEAAGVRNVGLRGASDARVASYARENGLCLVTADTGFADIRSYPPGEYKGIIVLRLPSKATSTTILELLKSALAQEDIISKLPGSLAIIESGRVRIRKR